MKLLELVDLDYERKVVLKSTMYSTETSTQIYTVPDAVHHYMKLKYSYRNFKKAKAFLKDLVEYED